MNILVFVKATIDRNALLDPDEIFPGDRDDKADIMTNNYDKHAIEAALKIVEEKGEGKVTAVCLGSDMADKVVKEAIAMGCHEAIRIENSDAEITNFFSVAKILAAAAKKSVLMICYCSECRVMIMVLLQWLQWYQNSLIFQLPLG